jgi:branched-chain amino acid transport system ATP-binding protein
MELLELRKVSKRFGDLVALNEVSLELATGEVFGLAGPNGSGKTTLFNVITGIYECEGEIRFEKHPISKLRPHQICRRGVARTFQNPMVFSSVSTYANIEVGAYFGRRNRDREREKIFEILDFVGLRGKEDVPAGSLALYDRKLTMLGAALATEPRMLLMDEPLAGLSPAEIDQSLKLIRKIHERLGMTIIIIEHHMRELVGVCQRMMVLNYGNTICIGTPAEVTGNPKVIEVYLGKGHA